MKQSNLLHTIRYAYTTRRPVMIWGAPGIGKSQIVQQAADAEGIPMIDLRLSQMESIDLRGLPMPTEHGTSWSAPAELPREEVHGPRGILFLDEVSAAAPSVQVAAYQLVLDRALGEYELPEGWAIVAAGNRQSDRAVAHKMSSALVSRFTHLDLDVDLDDWTGWAFSNGVDPRVVHFLRFRPELLHAFDPKTSDKPYPCPRSWATASDMLGADVSIRHELLSGTVGSGAAAELEGFIRDMDSLPDIDALLAAPDAAQLPDESKPSARYATVAAIAMKVSEPTIENAMRYLTRMPAEFRVLAVKTIVSSKPELARTEAMVQEFKALGREVFNT